MVKPLSFKGDKKVRKRKHPESTAADPDSATVQGEDQDSEEAWTTADIPSDLSGPIMILLPSLHIHSSDNDLIDRPTCLASDSAGTVFPSPVENMIPEAPVHLSAEPSDVRQVWVVTKVPGEDSGWTLKSHQGKYLSADRFGVVTCEREAAGMEEVFWFANPGGVIGDVKTEDDNKQVSDGTFHIRTSRKKYISISPSSVRTTQHNIRADTETPSPSSILHIRMQSRFKPKLKANRELKAKEKVSRKQLEEAVGRRLNEDEVRRLKKARRDGGWHEAVLDARVKGSHDKFA